MLLLEEAIVENYGTTVPAPLRKSSGPSQFQLGRNIRRRRLHVAGRTGASSQTRLLDPSDLSRLRACILTLNV
jgi:hypothetical protein